MNTTPLISIIVPSFLNSFCKKTLDSISKSIEGFHVEVIVVINKDGYEKEIKSLYNFVFLEHFTESVASARNFGVKYANSDHLLFIDDDMIVNQKSIKACLDFIETNPQDCLNVDWSYPLDLYETIKHQPFGRYLIKFGFTNSEGWANIRFKKEQLYQTNLFTSQFLLINKDQLENIGGYNEKFKHAGFEDYDFPERLKKNNVKFYLDTRVLIYHNEENKTKLKNWMLRKLTGGETRKTAVNFGYKELEINYSSLKKSIYKVLSYLYPLLVFIGSHLPNVKLFDKIYFKYFNILLGISIFKGYNKIKI